jgi:serine/threonine-protein kinase
MQVAKALRMAHQQGVVHRDIKPSNIRVLPDGVAKLLDFGIALFPAQELDRLTQTGAVLGSIRYMSPEQIHGQPVTPASDIFSFGAVIYELLTYRPAFPGDSLGSVIAAISQDAPPKIPDPQVPASFSRLVEGCLRKSPTDRWPSVERLLEGFAEVEEELWEAAMRDGSTQVGRMLLSDAEPLPEQADQDTVIVEPPVEQTTRSEPAPWKAATRKVPAPVELLEEMEPEEPEPKGGGLWAVLAMLALAGAVGLGVVALLEKPAPLGPAEEVLLLPVGPLPTAASRATLVPEIRPAVAAAPTRLQTSLPEATKTRTVAPTSVEPLAPAPLPERPRSAPSWVAELQGEDRSQRLLAARALARLGREAVEPLIGALRSSDAEIRILAATALGQIGGSANTAVPALSDAAGDPDPLVRVWANYALARIDWMDPAAVAALRKSAAEGDAAVREAAARALQHIELNQP